MALWLLLLLVVAAIDRRSGACHIFSLTIQSGGAGEAYGPLTESLTPYAIKPGGAKGTIILK